MMNGMNVKCNPLISCFNYCITCDLITPFDGDVHCFICGCDGPLCEINDYSITAEEWDEDVRITQEKICLISELHETHWIHTQNYNK